MSSIKSLFNVTLMFHICLHHDKSTFREHWLIFIPLKSTFLIPTFSILTNPEEWTFLLVNILFIKKFSFQINYLWKITSESTTENLFLNQCVPKSHVHLSKRRKKSRKEPSRKLLMLWNNGDNFTKKLTWKEKESTLWKVLLKRLDMPKRLLMITSINSDWPSIIILTSIDINLTKSEFWGGLLKPARKKKPKLALWC